jgi:hypothetical protein
VGGGELILQPLDLGLPRFEYVSILVHSRRPGLHQDLLADGSSLKALP